MSVTLLATHFPKNGLLIQRRPFLGKCVGDVVLLRRDSVSFIAGVVL